MHPLSYLFRPDVDQECETFCPPPPKTKAVGSVAAPAVPRPVAGSFYKNNRLVWLALRLELENAGAFRGVAA
jgi:hypothetical protein